jgi:hypothetical protein
MSARDMENDRLLREIAELWAKAEGASPHASKDEVGATDVDLESEALALESVFVDPALEASLSAELLERIVDRVTAFEGGRTASAEADLAPARHFSGDSADARRWLEPRLEGRRSPKRALWIGAIAAVTVATVGTRLVIDRDTHSVDSSTSPRAAADTRTPPRLSVAATAPGNDGLDIVCAECVDGTRISAAGVRATVSAQRAHLDPPKLLPLAESQVTLELLRPGAAAPELVNVTVPAVEYRMRADTSTLEGDGAELTLEVSAVPRTQVEVAGRRFIIDQKGTAKVRMALDRAQLLGPAEDVASFDQIIPYSFEPPSGKVSAGEMRVKIGVTPLVLEAPGEDTVTDLEQFKVAGRTSKGASLWIAGGSLAVDDTGHFAQSFAIDSVGITRVTLRATEPGLAPRFVSFLVERVENLERAGLTRSRSLQPLGAIGGSIAAHIGDTIVVSGRLAEVLADGERTLATLQYDPCQDSPCLAELIYGGPRELRSGDRITAIGKLRGVVSSGAGVAVPELDVSFLF